MKVLLAFIGIILLTAFTGAEKQLSVKGELKQWEQVYQVMEQSQAPHVQVEAAKKFIYDQIAEQLKDTTIKK